MNDVIDACANEQIEGDSEFYIIQPVQPRTRHILCGTFQRNIANTNVQHTSTALQPNADTSRSESE